MPIFLKNIEKAIDKRQVLWYNAICRMMSRSKESAASLTISEFRAHGGTMLKG